MAQFLGMIYPIVKSAKGYFPVSNGIELIKGDILTLLLTNPGERVMAPDYGTPLRNLLFDPNDAALAEQARQMIINSINKWEPRIVIDAIDVTTGDSDGLDPSDDRTEIESVLGIRILFRDPQDIRNVQELTLQVPLQGANNANNSA